LGLTRRRTIPSDGAIASAICVIGLLVILLVFWTARVAGRI
jgi:hypothetical protein